MQTSLPQNDPAPGARYRQLADAMDAYVWDYHGPMALLAQLPSDHQFKISRVLKRILSTQQFAANLAVVAIDEWLRPHARIIDYGRYFPLMRKPSVIRQFARDEIFGWQRHGGCNPLDVRCLDRAPADHDFPVTDAMIARVAGSKTTIADQLAEKRLFLADYSEFGATAARIDARDLGRHFAAAKVLYWQAPSGGALAPVAIQLEPEPGEHNPIFTPDDEHDWLAAKIFSQSGDTMAHEIKHHLAQTHLVLEPVAVAVHRRLAANHPIGILLRQHFEDMLAINGLGRRALINPGGFLDQLVPGWLRDTHGIIADCVKGYHWTNQAYHADLAARGLVGAPGDLPYRDDGELVWRALHTFVRDYLALYYTAPTDVARDGELHRWLEEMKGPGLCNGLPATLSTLDDVTALVTQIIWMCGPKHAAVNYPQWDYVAFVPNMPFCVYAPLPRKKGQYSSEDDLMRILPPRDEAMKQVLLMELLAGWQHSVFGDYRSGAFSDPRVAPLVAAFQASLRDAERKIEARNYRRPLPYSYLQPSRIPNSTNT